MNVQAGRMKRREKAQLVTQAGGAGNLWWFRREITLGTVVQLAAILIALAVWWSNLQSELALIRHDLNRLLQTNIQLQQHLHDLARDCQGYDYRLKALEEKTL